MTHLILLSVLNVAPGIQLADNVDARHVALSDPGIRQDDDGLPRVDAMTQGQLVAEQRRLDETRPSLVGPAVLLGVGGGLSISGAILFELVLGSITARIGLSDVVGAYFGLVLCSVAIGVGIVLAIVGTVQLVRQFIAQGRHAADTSAVQNRLDAINGQSGVTSALPKERFGVPGSMQTVFRF